MKLDRKQKILLTLIILAAAYLVWEVYNMFWGGDNAPAPQTTAPAIVPTQKITNITNQAKMPPAQAKVTPIAAPAEHPAPVMRQITIQAPLSADQIEYMKLVGQYQILHMRRMLADEQAAMVSSQAKVAQLDQQIARLTGGSLSSSTVGPAMMNSPLGYQLLYIDYQDGKWTATLNKSGQLQEVTIGMVLPDGVRVLRINESGAILQKNGQSYLINFYGTTPVATPPAPRMIPMRPVPVLEKKVVGEKKLAPLAKPAIQNKPVVATAPAKSPLTNNPGNIVNVPAALPKTPVYKEMPQENVNKNKMPPSAVHPTPAPPLKNPVTPAAMKSAPAATSTLTSAPKMPAQTPAAAEPTKALTIAPMAPASNTVAPVAATPASTGIASHVPAAAPVAPKKITDMTPANNANMPSNTELNNTATPAVKPLLTLTPQQKNTVQQLENFLAQNKVPGNLSDSEKTLMATPATRFTLQLLGSYKKSDLTDFVQANGLQDKAYIFHTFYLDKDWYVLIYGIFQTEEEALQTIKNFSPQVQQVKPWVRSIASVQEAIKLTPKK